MPFEQDFDATGAMGSMYNRGLCKDIGQVSRPDVVRFVSTHVKRWRGAVSQ